MVCWLDVAELSSNMAEALGGQRLGGSEVWRVRVLSYGTVRGGKEFDLQYFCSYDKAV